VFRPPPTQGPFARDFEAYYAAGATWNGGGDPWSRQVWKIERTIEGVDASREELLPYVGPAAALPLYGALARLPQPLAVRVWTTLLAACAGAFALAALALAGTRRWTALAGAALLASASGPETSAIALGQVALVSAAAIACALLAFERRSVAGGAIATLAAVLQPNLAVALIARVRDRSALAGASLAALAFAALTLAAGGGLAGVRAYAQRLAEHGAAERFVAIQHTPAAIAWAFGASAGVALTAGTLCAVAAVAIAVVAIVAAKLDPLDGTLLALAALPFAVPFFHEHDFVVELLPLTVLAIRGGGAPALTALAAALICVNWLNFAQRPEAAAQTVVLGLAAACGYVLLGPGTRATRTDLMPFAAVISLACITVPLGHAYPAPVWPDGLPSGYRAPAHADASAVWADEQRIAGLEARQPAWGALRALPLAGCIVLGIAVVRTGRRRTPA
jgi:hypothetical protein